eukprot:7743982-Pyramimonas_sp.AAC.1
MLQALPVGAVKSSQDNISATVPFPDDRSVRARVSEDERQAEEVRRQNVIANEKNDSIRLLLEM